MNIASFLIPRSMVTYLYDDFSLRQALEKIKNLWISGILNLYLFATFFARGITLPFASERVILSLWNGQSIRILFPLLTTEILLSES